MNEEYKNLLIKFKYCLMYKYLMLLKEKQELEYSNNRVKVKKLVRVKLD